MSVLTAFSIIGAARRVLPVMAMAAASLGAGGLSARAATPGWQGPGPVSIPTGQTAEFIHYACPAGEIVHSGGFAANSVGQASGANLNYNGPRLDESPPNFNEWGWLFQWPNGAPAGVVITFDIYCAKR